MVRTSSMVLWLAATMAWAEPPSAAQLAKLQHDIDKAQAEVDKKYEGRDLSGDERKQQMKERAAAESAVLDQAGVDRKDFARAGARLSKDDRSGYADERDKLDQKDKAAAGKKKSEPGEVVIERGTGNSDEDEAKAMDRAAGYGKTKSGASRKRK